MSETTYHGRNRDVILNRAKYYYYENEKEYGKIDILICLKKRNKN